MAASENLEGDAMRLATFNVENMFDRVKAMNLDTWADGKKVLEAHKVRIP
jgi:hypothetical protein